MQQQHCMPDVVTYTALIGAYEKGHQWRQALQVTSAHWHSCQAHGSLPLASPGCALLIAEAAPDLHCSGNGPVCLTWTVMRWAATHQPPRADDASARIAQHMELADLNRAIELA